MWVIAYTMRGMFLSVYKLESLLGRRILVVLRRDVEEGGEQLILKEVRVANAEMEKTCSADTIGL